MTSTQIRRSPSHGASAKPGLTARGEVTRQRIVDAATTLIFAQGVAQTTLDEVRALTGTSKS